MSIPKTFAKLVWEEIKFRRRYGQWSWKFEHHDDKP